MGIDHLRRIPRIPLVLLVLLATGIVRTAPCSGQTTVAADSTGRSAAARDTLVSLSPFTHLLLAPEELHAAVLRTAEEILQVQTVYYENRAIEGGRPGYPERGYPQSHLRGGRLEDLCFTLDGIQLTDPLLRIHSVLPAPHQLEGLIIAAGNLPADSPGSGGGLINLIARRPAGRLTGSAEVVSSEFSGRPQDSRRDLTRSQAFLGGRVPGVPPLSFHLSGSAAFRRDYLVKRDEKVFDLDVDPEDPASRDPDITYYGMPEDWNDFTPYTGDPYRQMDPNGLRLHPLDTFTGWWGYGFDTAWDLLGGLSLRLGTGTHLRATASRSRQTRAPYAFDRRYAMFWGLPREVERNAVIGTVGYDWDDPWRDTPSERTIWGTGEIDFPNERNLLQSARDLAALTFTHAPSPQLRFSGRASVLTFRRDMTVRRWVNAAGYHPSFDTYYGHTMSGAPQWEPDDRMTQVTLQPGLWNPYEEEARRYGYASLGGREYLDGSDPFWADESNTWKTLRLDATWQPAARYRLHAGLTRRAIQINRNEIIDPAHPAARVQRWEYDPVESGAYLRTRLEYPHLILDLGLRYDRWDPGRLPYFLDLRDPCGYSYRLTELWQPVDPFDSDVMPSRKRSLTALSPRFGLSHPLSERAVIFFSYGRYASLPAYQYLFRRGRLDDPEPLLGNPLLDLERTTTVEYGFRHAFSDLVQIEGTLWIRTSRNLVGTEYVPAFLAGSDNPYAFSIFVNTDDAAARGLTVSLRRRFRGIWSGTLRYTYSHSTITRDDPYEGFREQHQAADLPASLLPAGWDIPHQLTLTALLRTPKGYGPRLWLIRPLELWSAALIVHAESGHPYTPLSQAGPVETYSARLPSFWQADLRLGRDISFFGVNAGLFCTVRNLLGRRRVLIVYRNTGRPDDPGPGTTGHSDYYDRSHYLGPPRLIDAGIRIRF